MTGYDRRLVRRGHFLSGYRQGWSSSVLDVSRGTGMVEFGVSSVRASWVWLRVVRLILGRIQAGRSQSR